MKGPASNPKRVEVQRAASIKVRLWRNDSVLQPPFVSGERMMDLLKRIGIRIDGALVMRSGTPIPLDETVAYDDDLTVIDVQSGG